MRRPPRATSTDASHPWAGLVAERGGVVRSPGDGPLQGDAPFAAVLVVGDGVLPAAARLGEATYLLKAGRVGGVEGEPGSLEISEALVACVLDAALAGEVEWERDPDFGYEVAAKVPGVEAPQDGLLLPRLLYRRADRVYEHAAIVPRVRREVAHLSAIH